MNHYSVEASGLFSHFNIVLYISTLKEAIYTSTSGCHSVILFRMLNFERC